jgi:two-component system cell cycle response regulator CtrA
MRILVIDGNSLSARALHAALSADGFQVFLCASSDEGIDLLKTYEYDAVVCRAAWGEDAGRDTARLRASNMATPVLVLSDDGLASSRVTALLQGADDCLSKPYQRAELFARLRALVRRSRSLPRSTINVGNLEIDFDERVVRIAGQPIHLTTTEYRMLELLALRKGRIVSKQALFESLYDGSDDPEEKVINVFVSKLRKKIAEQNSGESYIGTVWGSGYRLGDPLARAA